ncbi:hypothetical protein GBA63_05160 [Rubrobacter tropicus]|uniref:Uncharacterized protein n=1 Tax=Rubrobacter tropicus TaxID=2653851 RepID=A0A6G8Q6L4_9ACTN|nr:hypothetical protein [Rubrobacter tropicus]QIN82100.1 hypothetical protein GBA63_05160 [Rubrobacter tropicus]
MPPDRDLDRELRDLGPHVEYPPVPDLAVSVRNRLEADAGSPESTSRSRPQLWWIAAAALALLVAIPVLSLSIQGMGGGGSSVGGGAAGGSAVRESREGGGDVAGRGAPTSMAMESGASAASAEAACASPEPILEAKPALGAPGDEFGIRGRYFDGNLTDCDDDPARGVRVEFLQDGRTWELGRLVSDKDSRLAAKLEVPADVGSGRATVRATYGQGPPQDPYGRASAEARFLVTE